MREECGVDGCSVGGEGCMWEECGVDGCTCTRHEEGWTLGRVTGGSVHQRLETGGPWAGVLAVDGCNSVAGDGWTVGRCVDVRWCEYVRSSVKGCKMIGEFVSGLRVCSRSGRVGCAAARGSAGWMGVVWLERGGCGRCGGGRVVREVGDGEDVGGVWGGWPH